MFLRIALADFSLRSLGAPNVPNMLAVKTKQNKNDIRLCDCGIFDAVSIIVLIHVFNIQSNLIYQCIHSFVWNQLIPLIMYELGVESS